jgi:hypothetical protein
MILSYSTIHIIQYKEKLEIHTQHKQFWVLNLSSLIIFKAVRLKEKKQWT